MTKAESGNDAEIRAMAAAWLARIHSDDVSSAEVAGFQTWLGESERHRDAFDRVTMTWEAVGTANLYTLAALRPARAAPATTTVRRAVLSFGLMIAVGIGAALWVWTDTDEIYVTEVGEQLRVPLSDGSAIVLDTDTSIRVQFSVARRRVELERGRAFFEVARDRERPFIVRAGNRQVVALGTAFDVRREHDSLTVVLVSGHVAVELADLAFDPAAIELQSPGEFAELTAGRAVERGQVDLETAIAWRSGVIVFEGEPLRSAVVEMSRYSRRPIVLADPSLGDLRISGVFRIGDSEAFGHSISVLLPVSVTFEQQRVVMMRKPEGDKN